jgi:hypothetical protein
MMSQSGDITVKEGLQGEPMEMKYEGYQLGTDSLLLYNNRMYVPNSTYLRKLVLQGINLYGLG